MAVAIGSSAYDSLVPALTDAADIQKALKVYHYGADPFTTTVSSGVGIAGHLLKLYEDKSTSLNPTFLGTVTLPTGTSSVGPLKFVAGTNLTSPLAGMMEFSGTTLSFSPSDGTRKTIAFTDSAITSTVYLGTTGVALNRTSGAQTLAGVTAEKAQNVVYYGGSSGTMSYAAPNQKIYTGSTPPTLTSGDIGSIWMW